LGRNSPFSIDKTHGLYNSLYYRTCPDSLLPLLNSAKMVVCFGVTMSCVLCRQSKRLQITCPKFERFGRIEVQSGWYVCVAKPFTLVKPCLVYSFG